MFMKTGPTTGSVTEEAITSQIPTLETSTSGKQEHTNMQKLNVRGTVVRRQGPRLSIRIDIWILPSDSWIGRRQCYLPDPRPFIPVFFRIIFLQIYLL